MVSGGRLSEGQNFSDDLCRGLFFIGVPNMYVGDIKLKMKKRFYKQKASLFSNSEELYWKYYNSKRNQAILQAVGRGVRNQHDYCSVILCDKRYNYIAKELFADIPILKLTKTSITNFVKSKRNQKKCEQKINDFVDWITPPKEIQEK